jgi:hypothetical protein
MSILLSFLKGSKARSFVPQAQIKAWKREDAALEKRIEKISARRVSIRELIKHAQTLDALEEEATPSVARKRRGNKRRKRPAEAVAPAKVHDDRRRGRKGRWATFISDIVKKSGTGMVPYAQVKQEAKAIPSLGAALERSDKGFYHAISKLNKAGTLTAYKGHLFTNAAFAQFQNDLKAGRTNDIKVSNSAHHSPMGDAVEAMMRTRPNGAKSGHIIWELRKTPEFAETIEKNKTHPYNVLARLVKTGRLVKRGTKYYSAEMKTPSKEEGASTLFGEGGSSSKPGRGAA